MGRSFEETAEPVVEELVDLTEEDIEDFARLLPQLSEKQQLLSTEEIEAHMRAAVNPANEDSRVLVIRGEDGRIQASATGTICRIPVGEKAWIDDVVTDKDHRGHGWGRQLMKELEEWLAGRGVTSVNLTSAPAREAAGNLYENTGYFERPTRVYRKDLGRAAVTHS